MGGLMADVGAVPRFRHQLNEMGRSLLKRDVIASEWREHDVEFGNQAVLQRLLHAARLLRNRDYFVHRREVLPRLHVGGT
jgi:hypothetical protein